MLTRIVRSVLGASLSVLPVLAMLLLCGPLLRRYAPRLRHLLWLAVTARLLLPISVPGAARLLLPAGEKVYMLERDSAAILRAFAEAEAGFANPALAAGAAADTPLPLMTVLAAVWLIGAAAFLACQMAAHCVAARRLRRWSLPVADPEALALMNELRAGLGIRRHVGLYKSRRVAAPMLMGLLLPRILLPWGMEGRHMEVVLRHELTHLRRRDLWYKLALLTARALHWFNPAVHLMARVAETAMELACDQDALSAADIAARRRYGHAVLFFTGARCAGPALATRFLSGKRQMKQRMLEIMNTDRKKRGILPLSISVAAILISALMISCGDIQPDTAPISQADTPSVSVADTGERHGPEEEGPAVVEEDVEAFDFTAQDKAREQLQEIFDQVAYMDAPYDNAQMLWPAADMYRILAVYGSRYDGNDFHTGIDITAAEENPYGWPVVSAAEGTVQFVNQSDSPGVGYGIYIIVDHGGGVSTLYAHLSAVEVKPGDGVEQGQVIGQVGSTGWSQEPHLHFEVRENGTHVDPQPYLIDQ